MRIAAVLTALEEVSRYVLDVAGQAGLPAAAAYRLRLAADELATNIVVHGYHESGEELVVSGGMDEEHVWVRFKDHAPPFDPREGMRTPDLDIPLADRQVGGLGVFLILSSVDDFSYRLVSGCNISTLLVRRQDERRTD